MASPQLNNISQFWKWFAENNVVLGHKDVPESLVAQLEEHLFAIDRFDWEIGPGSVRQHRFSLSPCGDIEKLTLTQTIVKAAPSLDGWEFYSAKQPREWMLSFSLMADNLPVEIDAKLWEIVVYKLKNGMYDILFKPNTTMGLKEEHLYWAATIILDGELGEEKRIEKIAGVEIVSDWSDDTRKSARALEVGMLNRIIK
jgi:hypothetical protein